MVSQFLKNDFFFLVLLINIDCEVGPTHNLYFGAKIRNVRLPLHTPVLLYKSLVYWEYTFHGHVII